MVNQVSDSIAPSTVDMVKCKLLYGAAAWEGGRVSCDFVILLSLQDSKFYSFPHAFSTVPSLQGASVLPNFPILKPIIPKTATPGPPCIQVFPLRIGLVFPGVMSRPVAPGSPDSVLSFFTYFLWSLPALQTRVGSGATRLDLGVYSPPYK